MHSAAANGDTDTLRQAAHQLKSSSAVVAATALSDMCATLERRISDGEQADWRDATRLIEAEYTRVKPALEAINVS
jgi:HPt (histidine-containing phosphotransfer) domain-containing protein